MRAGAKFGNPSELGAITGMVAGLGTITPVSSLVGSAGTLSIDISLGVMCHYVMQAVK
jgi:Amt family ammonium transporter